MPSRRLVRSIFCTMGPEQPLADHGTISIIGPGTGLGVAHVWRMGNSYHVQATEGGHIDFAPLDSIEDALLDALAQKISPCFGRARCVGSGDCRDL